MVSGISNIRRGAKQVNGNQQATAGQQGLRGTGREGKDSSPSSEPAVWLVSMFANRAVLEYFLQSNTTTNKCFKDTDSFERCSSGLTLYKWGN